MIDFVRINYKDKSEFEPYVSNSENFPQLFQVLECHSGEIQYPYKTNLGVMDVVIAERSGYVKNSLHKLYNDRNLNLDMNHDDFTYSKLCASIQYLSGLPDVTQTGLTQLEFGLNINVDTPAEEIIRNNVIMHNCKGYNHNKKFKGKGELKQYDRSNYIIKVYDKAKQYEIEENIFRFEIKFTRRDDFNNAGVFNLEDLKNRDKLTDLFKIFLIRFDEMKIIDSFTETSMELLDYQKLIKFMNSKHWEVDIKNMSDSTKARHKRQFNQLINKYNLDSTKKELRRLFLEKFEYLINN